MSEGQSVAEMVQELEQIQNTPKKCRVCRLILSFAVLIFLGTLVLWYVLVERKVAITAATQVQLVPERVNEQVSGAELNTKVNEFAESVKKANALGTTTMTVRYTTSTATSADPWAHMKEEMDTRSTPK